MRLVLALGGNALLRRGEPADWRHQQANARRAAALIAPLARQHELVVTHGNGPQVGLLAEQVAAAGEGAGWPLDVLGAETEGMIGYLLEQELGNCLSGDPALASLLTRIVVAPDDPAFARPSKFVGPGYSEATAQRLRVRHQWHFAPDGAAWRRVVPSPEPRRLVDIRPIRWLLARGAVVICAGGGGIPCIPDEGDIATATSFTGVEAVIDKDLSSALLAQELEADCFVMLTDVAGVYAGWGTAGQRLIAHSTPPALREMTFAAGSMGPKVAAACRFVTATGRPACIGALADLEALLAGTRGTRVTPAGNMEH